MPLLMPLLVPLMRKLRAFVLLFSILALSSAAYAQETTGGLQGTVKDPSGAVVPRALVIATGTTLVGRKETETDASGYYRFANLPPGTYVVTVTLKGFKTARRGGLPIEVGQLPTIDFALEIAVVESTVEVIVETPPIDVTATHSQTNITRDVLDLVPTGISFQSVIQFAPPARNEPLAGNNAPKNTGAGPHMAGVGTGGAAPAITSNGKTFGFQVAGGSDSENRYLVEGQDTASVVGGYSHTDVPFNFIHEVQVKTSGIEAEHGGTMGGVINTIMKRAGNAWHGSLGIDYEGDKLDANQNTPVLRYDPQDPGVLSAAGNPLADPTAQTYQQREDRFRYHQPSFTIGGPLLKDRLGIFVGVAPKYLSTDRTVDFGAANSNAGPQTFNQDQQTYFTTARVDAAVTQKVRLFSSWLYQFQRENGVALPLGDSTTSLFNPSATVPLFAYKHDYGFVAPNQTVNLGGDVVLSPRLIATTRFGYFFENYHDFGFPTTGQTFIWLTPGTTGAPGSGGIEDNAGATLPLSLQQPSGYFSAGYNDNFTIRNASKHHQFDQDVAWFKTGWMGTHNFKFGYQFNRASNDLFQHTNVPQVRLSVGQGNFFTWGGSTGQTNCAAYVANGGFGQVDPVSNDLVACAGKYGFLTVVDLGSLSESSSVNHSLYAQDAWSIGKGITINAGLRVEKEYLPERPINFAWGDKIAPRLGVAWDVFRDGRMKVHGGYAVYNDQMKLTLAIAGFGGQYWQNCFYAMDTSDLNTIDVVPGAASRYCVGDSDSGANFASGKTPAGLTFLENQNYRGTEDPDSGLKPYRQHESVFGVDYTLTKNLTFAARWDRRRLDRAIEDAAVFDSTGSETFQVVNPGFGGNAVNRAPSCTDPAGPGCPPNFKAERSYDGLEMSLTWTGRKSWFGTFSYVYSKLRGNYSGLTTTELADGGGGRNAPNLSRAFDESHFQFDANGGSSSGPLGTDRPHAFKAYGYYRKPWKGGWTSTSIGLFQTFYSGTPKSSYVDVGFSIPNPPYSGLFPVYPEGRGKWADIALAPDSAGVMIPHVASVCACRTPWYVQSDVNLRQEFKVNKGNEAQALTFEATFANLFNRQAPTAYYSQIDTANFQSFLLPGGSFSYAAFEHAYDWKKQLATDSVIGNSLYGQPLYYQQRRSIRLTLRFTF